MKLLKFSIIFLTILFLANIAMAKVTPPIPEKSNLILRYSFDDYTYYHFGFEQTLYDDNNSEDWNAYGSLSYSTDWKTDGQYSLYGDVSGGNAALYETFSFKIVVTYDVFILSKANNGKLRVLINNNVVKTYESGEHLNESLTVPPNSEIKFEWYAPDSSDTIRAYIDNIRILKIQVDDQSGNNHIGDIHNMNWTAGRYQYGLKSNGNGNITTKDNFTLTNFTITAWVNFSNNVWYLLYAKNDTCGISIFYSYSSLQGRTYAGSSSASSAFSDDRLTKNQWHFVAITGRYNPDYQRLYVKIYIDAEWDGSEYACDYIPATVQLILFKDLQGVVDEIRLWNKELTQSDIREMYEAMRIKAYSEMNITEIIYPLSLTIQSSYQVTPQFDEINKVAVVFYSNITEGEWFITASSEDFARRTISVTITDNYELHEINIYLPPSSQTVTIQFTLRDYTNRFSNKPKLIVKKALPNGLAIIASQYFDSGLQTYVNLVSGELYQLYVSNGAEMRSVGYYSSTVSTSAVIIVGNLTIVPVSYGGVVQFNYTYDAKNQTLYFNYVTIDGVTTYTNLTIYNESGGVVYYAESTEPNGAYTVLNLSNTTNYWIEFYAVNSLGVVHFKQLLVVTSKKIGISIPPTIGNILFIGLAILVVLMSTTFSLPIGLMIATGILAFATMNGWTTLPTSLVWGLVVITAISFFIQKRGVSGL